MKRRFLGILTSMFLTAFGAACQGVDTESPDSGCVTSRLLLSPVTFNPVPVNSADRRQPCSELSIVVINVWIFQEGSLVAQRIFECQGDSYEFGRLCPGTYQLGATAFSLYKGYAVGIDILREIYPSRPDCNPTNRACFPIDFDVSSSEPTTIPVHLVCDDFFTPGVMDICGGA